MPEAVRDNTLDALRALLTRLPPERIERLLADIRLSEFSGAIK